MILAIGGIKNYLYLMLYHPDDFNNEDVKDDINNYLDKLYINKTYRGDLIKLSPLFSIYNF